MHPNNIEPELEQAKQRIEQLEGFKQFKKSKYFKILIRYFEDFNPIKISGENDLIGYEDYTLYIDFKHTLNFQGTNGAFEKLASETGLIPTGWWHKDGITTIAFDKVFYPKSTALVDDPYCAGCVGECTCFGA